jgi:excisionase family DNA binding protein
MSEFVTIEKPVFDKLIQTLDRINAQLIGNQIESPTYLTMEELRKYLNLSDVTIYRYIREFNLPTLKFGNQRRFIKSEIDAWVESQKINR